MATKEPPTMTAKDKERMRHLQDEIRERYSEMAAIARRVLGDEGMSAAAEPGSRLVLAVKAPDGRDSGGATERAPYICIEVNGGAWEDPPGWCRYGGCF